MTDFIIVGKGLAAAVMAHTLHQRKLSFKIVGNSDLSSCSLVAAGIWNPVVFKRMNSSWKAEVLIPKLKTFYSECEALLQTKFLFDRPIIKLFSEEREQNLWLGKSKNELAEFLNVPEADTNSIDLINCQTEAGFGKVNQSGYLNTAHFINATMFHFKGLILNETFEYAALKSERGKFVYKTIEANNIIFCEGHLIKNNPYFNWLPMKPVKGELLEIKASDLILEKHILNKNGFLFKSQNGTFKVGATYVWEDLNELPTEAGKQELVEKLKHMIGVSYSIEKQMAGIRPASSDRRPLVGAHPDFKNLFVFNGLGAKGVMLAPYCAENFINFYFQKEKLNIEVDIKRFNHLYHG
jgi:glycine oxidase